MSVQNFRVGGFASDNPDDFILLMVHWNTTGVVSTFRKSGTSAGYQVTANKSFYICKINIMESNNNVTAQAIALGYSDTDHGFYSVVARTNHAVVLGMPDESAVPNLCVLACFVGGTTGS